MIRVAGCTCDYRSDGLLLKRCDACWDDYHALDAIARHAKKIETKVLDKAPHIARPLVWHVIECACGWSSALHEKPEQATEAFNAHASEA